MHCSLCHYAVARALRYCPHCGAEYLPDSPHLEVVGVAGRMQLFTDRVRVAHTQHRTITQVTDLPLAEIRQVTLGHHGSARYLQLLREGDAPLASTPAALMQHAGTVATTQKGVPALAVLYHALQARCPQATFTASIPLPAPITPPPVVAPPVVAPPISPAPDVPPSTAPAPASSPSAPAGGAPPPGSVPCAHCQQCCGTGDRFCGMCGATLPVTAANTAPKMMALGYTILLVLAGVLLWGIVAVVGNIRQHVIAQRPPATVATAPTSSHTSATSSPTHTTPRPTPAPAPAPAPAATYPCPAPSAYAQGTPERAFAEYMAAWRAQDWTRMVRWTQATWRASDGQAAQTLATWNDWRQLRGYQVLQITRVSDVCVDIAYECWVETSLTGPPTVKKITSSARLVRERGARQPSPQGTWGVNPIIPSTAQ
ncbi:MAG: hypothetical protein BWY76_01172 [bacterium ADurb.Bin429]|nr:MAG: hypothetical protein BWY76_01172 [bacterium ADurb.Bin429]